MIITNINFRNFVWIRTADAATPHTSAPDTLLCQFMFWLVDLAGSEGLEGATSQLQHSHTVLFSLYTTCGVFSMWRWSMVARHMNLVTS